MKSLKESLLRDQEDALSDFDTLEKDLRAEMKEFLKAISAAKNYEGGYILKNGRSNKVFTPTALRKLGYDANHIEIFMYTMDNFSYTNPNDDWALEITLSKRSDDNMKHICSVWKKKIYMDRWAFDKWNEVVKNLIKPAVKTKDTFKKFLASIEQWDQQLVSPSILLK